MNSSWGLGEALVSGHIDPDEFRVRKRDLTLLMSRAGVHGEPTVERPGSSESSARLPEDGHVEGPRLSLNAVQVHDLAVLLVAIERHYGSPQDVEWCHDGTQFWVVQSRPITARGAAAAGHRMDEGQSGRGAARSDFASSAGVVRRDAEPGAADVTCAV